jgi:hypothetical protein
VRKELGVERRRLLIGLGVLATGLLSWVFGGRLEARSRKGGSVTAPGGEGDDRHPRQDDEWRFTVHGLGPEAPFDDA